MTQIWNEAEAQELVRKSVLRELPPGASLPGNEDDLVATGHIDSMGWVGILSAIEAATGIRNFGNLWSEGTPQSIRVLAGIIMESAGQARQEAAHEKPAGKAGLPSRVSILGWGYSLGSLTVEADTIERECGLPAGTMREGAGIETVRRVSAEEDELTLGQRAVADALAKSHLDVEAVDFLVATSTTFLEFPSLAAALHTRPPAPRLLRRHRYRWGMRRGYLCACRSPGLSAYGSVQGRPRRGLRGSQPKACGVFIPRRIPRSVW